MLDPYYGNVSLLLPMNGANNGTVFTDYSPTPKSITRTGAVTSTAQSKYYGSSGYFDAAADYLRIDSTNVFNFGTADFTVEGWIYILSPSIDIYPYLISTSPYNSGSGFYMGVDGAGTSWGGTGRLSFNGATTMTYGPKVLSTSIIRGAGWKHFEVTRVGATTRMFIDGVLEATHVAAGVANYTSTASPYLMTDIAGPTLSTQQYCYAQDFRVTKGIARHTADFTPPSRLLPGVSGVIRDINGAPCSRQIYVYNRSTGALLASTTSDASTGYYEALVHPAAAEVFRVVVANEVDTYNYLTDRIIPA